VSRPASFWDRHSQLLLGTLVAAAPLIMGGWLLIGPNTIGNDYPRVQPYGSQTLRFYTRHGIEPMWYPHLAGGVPIGFLPFAPYSHLPAWPSSELPGYWTGNALLILSARHLLLLAGYHALLAWAASRLLGCGREWGALLGFALVYNLKTLDSLRYGPALEATVYGHACRRPPIGNCAVGTRPRGLPAMGADVREPRGGGFSAAEYLHTPTEETAGSMANSRAPRNHEYDCSASAAVSIAYIAAGPWRLHIDSVARSRLALELRRGSPTIQVRGVVVRRRATGYGLPRCPRSLLPRMG